MEERAGALRGEGRRPYAIPVGGSNAVGALGYIECARELSAQADGMGLVVTVSDIPRAGAYSGTPTNVNFSVAHSDMAFVARVRLLRASSAGLPTNFG